MAQILVYISPIFAIIVIIYCFYRLLFNYTRFSTLRSPRNRRGRRCRRRRMVIRVLQRNIVPPSPEVPPPTYDSDGPRIGVPDVFVIPSDASLPKYEAALTLQDVKPPSYTVAFVCDDLLPPSYERARSHTSYIIDRPVSENGSSLCRTCSLPRTPSAAVAEVRAVETLDPQNLSTDEVYHF